MISRVGPKRRIGVGHRFKRRAGGQSFKDQIERLAERCRVDVADYRNEQLVAGEDAAGIAPEVAGRDGGDRRHGPFDRAPIGVIVKGEAIPGERRHGLGVVLVEFQPGQNLRAHALDRILIETRFGQREPQEIEHLVLVGGERLQACEHDVAARVEIHAHGKSLLALLKGDRTERAGALVHHGGDEIGEAFLALRVLGGTAAEGKAHGDQRVGVTFDKPSLDAARADDALDLHVANLSCGSARNDERRGSQSCAVPHQGAKDGAPQCHDRYDLPLAGALTGFSPTELVVARTGSR